MRDFGLTYGQAERYRPGRAAVVCVPIPDARERVAGALSLDAKTDVFTPELIARAEEELALFYEALEIF